jgi:hypothetical protein
MSTTSPVTSPAIPMTDGSSEANQQAILALKQNIEIMQGTRGIVRASSLHPPTAVNTQTGAALRRVQSTYP